MVMAVSGPGLVSAQGQRPVFRGATELVRVDVIVTDEDGRFVDDLQPQDFRIFEDDEEQRLVDVQLVDLRRGVVQRAGGGAANAAASGVAVIEDAGVNRWFDSQSGSFWTL